MRHSTKGVAILEALPSITISQSDATICASGKFAPPFLTCGYLSLPKNT